MHKPIKYVACVQTLDHKVVQQVCTNVSMAMLVHQHAMNSKENDMGTTKNSLEDVANEIQDQMLEIIRRGNRPAYVILDRSTWLMIRGSHNAEECVQFGHKQKDYESPDKICGLMVAVLTGHKDEQVIKVVE